MNKPTIIIWEWQWWQSNIDNALQDRWYKTVLTNRNTHKFPAAIWPRDCFVDYNGVYLDSRNETKHPFGEGWNVLVGEDFALLSEESVCYEYDGPEEVQNALRSVLGSNKITAYVAPNWSNYRNKDFNNIDNSHLDLFILLCPKKKLLFWDTNYINTYYKDQTNMRKEIARISDILTNLLWLQCIEYNWSNDWIFPLNWLVLPWQSSEDTDLVVIDSASKKLNKILQNNGVDVITVDMPQKSYDKTCGKIRCQTNTIDDTVDSKQLDYLLHN
jgi:hypothetical protein